MNMDVSKIQLGPMHQLLLRLARLTLTAEDHVFVAARVEDADWAELFELARRGGVCGLVSRHIERGRLPLPAAWRKRFCAAALCTEAQNRVLVAEARRLCAAAEEEGLTLIPLKGAALNMGLPYADLGLRPMVDLDLLTRRGEMAHLEGLLLRCGFSPCGQRATYLRWYHHTGYFRQVGGIGVLVELHWTALHVMYGHPGIDGEVVARAGLRSVEGEPLRFLDPAAMLLSVALHVAVHRYRAGLKWLVDVAELARSTAAEIDWDWLWRTAHAAGARRALSHVFHLARHLLAAPLPAERGSLLQSALGHLSPPETLVCSAPQPRLLGRVAINLLQYDSPLDGLAYAFHKGAEILERTTGIERPRWLARRSLLGGGSRSRGERRAVQHQWERLGGASVGESEK
jgi:hypothetical protein